MKLQNIRLSHRLPMNPRLHLQMLYPVHTPPFWQGRLQLIRERTEIKNNYFNDIYFTVLKLKITILMTYILQHVSHRKACFEILRQSQMFYSGKIHPELILSLSYVNYINSFYLNTI